MSTGNYDKSFVGHGHRIKSDHTQPLNSNSILCNCYFGKISNELPESTIISRLEPIFSAFRKTY